FLDSFKNVAEYADSFGVQYPIILLSMSQISETVFILAIPFFLKNFGIKRVMLISMLAWVLRFGLFAYGNPGSGLPLFILSMIVYGMAFDFFNISGSLYVEERTNPNIRASAQGLFMIMTNGIGAIIGSYGSGAVVDFFSQYDVDKTLVSRDWHTIWLIFAGYALVVAVLFAIVFRYKHVKKTA
ncbi:MAG: MFS transporter, partial [Bacteroides sp.]|nr:MFS transporter [Bacteroides sp.]